MTASREESSRPIANDNASGTPMISSAKKAKKLMNCPVCDWKVSKAAHFCPNCGEPDPSNRLMIGAWISRIFWTIVIIAVVYFGYNTLWPMLLDMIKDL